MFGNVYNHADTLVNRVSRPSRTVSRMGEERGEGFMNILHVVGAKILSQIKVDSFWKRVKYFAKFWNIVGDGNSVIV